MMVKIHIAGGSGSGKTTLAEKIAAMLQIACYELDALKPDATLAIARESAWVTEGVHVVWIDPLLDQVDYVVWLEVSWPVAMWRIITRHIKKSLNGTNRHPGMMNLYRFLRGTRSFYLDTDPAVAEFVRRDLEEYRAHRGTVDAEILQRRLEKCMQAIPELSVHLIRSYLEQYLGSRKEEIIVVRNRADRERLLEMLKVQHLKERAELERNSHSDR